MTITLTRSILGAAFAQYGRADAIHLGPPTEAGLVVGVDNVARLVAGQDPLNTPAMISWGADKSIVASRSGVGVTIGPIRPGCACRRSTRRVPVLHDLASAGRRRALARHRRVMSDCP